MKCTNGQISNITVYIQCQLKLHVQDNLKLQKLLVGKYQTKVTYKPNGNETWDYKQTLIFRVTRVLRK